eukprot:3737808-Prymnesium_polylepis.2
MANPFDKASSFLPSVVATGRRQQHSKHGKRRVPTPQDMRVISTTCSRPSGALQTLPAARSSLAPVDGPGSVSTSWFRGTLISAANQTETSRS